MSERTRRITRIGVWAGYVVALAAAIGLVTIGLSQAVGAPWDTVNDLALLVTIGALAPLMLSFYELGGLTPLRVAQLAQILGWTSVITWGVLQKAVLLGAVEFAFDAPATGLFALGSLALGYIGLWIAGANLLAGPWLTAIRWLGLLVGLALTLFAVGLLLGGVDSGWTFLGGAGFLFFGSIWALLMARLLRSRLSGDRNGAAPAA